jgi:hypothetical protein
LGQPKTWKDKLNHMRKQRKRLKLDTRFVELWWLEMPIRCRISSLRWNKDTKWGGRATINSQLWIDALPHTKSFPGLLSKHPSSSCLASRIHSVISSWFWRATGPCVRENVKWQSPQELWVQSWNLKFIHTSESQREIGSLLHSKSSKSPQNMSGPIPVSGIYQGIVSIHWELAPLANCGNDKADRLFPWAH